MIKILNILYINNFKLKIEFDDNCIKMYDFSELIDFIGIANDLKKVDYFKNVTIINNGRGIAWENGYDCCADWLRYFAKDSSNEWIDFTDEIGLNERIQISNQKYKCQAV